MKDELRDLIEKFDQGELCIDIDVYRNPEIWQEYKELASILDAYSPVTPFTMEPWSKYVPEKIAEEWEYLTCIDGDGTASGGIPEGADVILARSFINIANASMSQIAEDFESVFNSLPDC